MQFSNWTCLGIQFKKRVICCQLCKICNTERCSMIHRCVWIIAYSFICEFEHNYIDAYKYLRLNGLVFKFFKFSFKIIFSFIISYTTSKSQNKPLMDLTETVFVQFPNSYKTLLTLLTLTLRTYIDQIDIDRPRQSRLSYWLDWLLWKNSISLKS